MAFRCIIFTALVAVAHAGVISSPAVLAPGALLGARLAAPLPYAAAPQLLARSPIARLAAPLPLAATPIGRAVVPAAIDTDYDPNPSYSYAYDIQDALTGDSKNQQESRQGDVVQGSYSLTEPDGTRRTVEYTADPVNGFNAVVHREPLAVANAVVAAPAIAKVAAPVAYAAPSFAHSIAAPAIAHSISRVAAPIYG